MDSSAKTSKLDEDVKTYCDVLAKCSLPDVAKWKDEDLERAFRWSSYFKQVHSRCMHRASLMEKFDKRFRDIGRRGGWRFGGEPLSCAFLGKSREYLTKALLENPALPASLHENVLHRYAESEGREAHEAMVKHVKEFDSCKELLKTMQAVHVRVKEHAETCHPACTPQPGLVSIDATCLLSDVHWLLSVSQGKQEFMTAHVTSIETVVHKKLFSLVHETRDGLNVVLHSLLISSSADSGEIKASRRVILDWLLQQLRHETGLASGSKLNTFQQRLLSDCSPSLLSKVSTAHTEFFREYVKLLKLKAEDIELSWIHHIIKCNTGMPTMDTDCEEDSTLCVQPKDDFDHLLDHFGTLTRSGGQTKEACVSLLKSKIQSPIAVKYHLPPVVGTIWNRILHAVVVGNIDIENRDW